MYTVVEFQPILHAIKTLRRTCWWAHGQILPKARSSSSRRERNWSDLVARGASSSSMVQGGPVLRTLAGGSATGQVRTVTCRALRNGTRNSETLSHQQVDASARPRDDPKWLVVSSWRGELGNLPVVKM